MEQSRGIGESAISVILVEGIVNGWIRMRTAINVNSAFFTPNVVLWCIRGVVRYIEVQMPIVIYIRKRATGSPVRIANSGVCCHIREGSVAIIPIELIFTEVGDV